MRVESSVLFAPKDVYGPCGMFTLGHLILLVIGLIALGVLLYLSKSWSKEEISKITKRVAVLVVVLEGIKIGFNFYHGYTWLDAWVPISYCSIFIYALLFVGFGKGRIYSMGEAYIAGTATIAGFVFLIFPTTSLMQYPMWHYLSMYSMFFHIMMMFMGIIYIRRLEVSLDRRTFLSFASLYGVFAVFALVINTVTGSNLMIIREPYNIPIPFLHTLYQRIPWVYTLLAILTYLLGPYLVTAFWVTKRKRNDK